MVLDGNVQHVWGSDPTEGYVLCETMDIGYKHLELKRIDNDEKLCKPYEEVYPADDDIEKDLDDSCSLMYLNEAMLLHNCRLRYHKKKFYTYVGNILIVINPYEQIPEAYNTQTMRTYRGKSLGSLPPHIFAIADKAYRDMMRNYESQSVVISGESGAGKTESQKHILKFLCESWGESGGVIEQRLLDSSPILEAFGNARTGRNNNSSRFGKFIEIHFNEKGSIVGGYVSHYLLERTRLCSQKFPERNFHIFYQLIAGADINLAVKLKLSSPDKYNYLKIGSVQFFLNDISNQSVSKWRKAAGQDACLQDDVIDDYSDFQRLLEAFSRINIDNGERDEILETVAAILHLGNVEFTEDEDEDGCYVESNCENSLHSAAELLGLNATDLCDRLCTRLMQPTRGGVKGTMYQLHLHAHEALNARDALAKAIYVRLFDAIVKKVNKCIPLNSSALYIGVLDTAGFELFLSNSFEQFCINYCNEKLQNFFIERILKNEQNSYIADGLDFEPIHYVDNSDCIDLIAHHFRGIYALLDNEARLPKPSVRHFTESVIEKYAEHPCLKAPQLARKSGTTGFEDSFTIRHFAAEVTYDTSDFLDKNNDSLHASLECLMQESSKKLLREIFCDNVPSGSGTLNPRFTFSRLVAPSVSKKFRKQLEELLEKLRNTGTHFVRCIKPNSMMKPDAFNGHEILVQLKCAGMDSALKVMHAGFPSRVSYKALFEMYKHYLPPQLASVDERLFCRCLFRAVGLSESDFKFGLTKAFFRTGKYAEFDKMMHQDKTNIQKLILSSCAWLAKMRFKKVQCAAICVIRMKKWMQNREKCSTKIQSVVRGYLARKRYKPRIAMFKKLIVLMDFVCGFKSAVDTLTETSQLQWAPKVIKLQKSTEIMITNLKRNPDILISALLDRYENLNRFAHEVIESIKNQMVIDKQIKVKEELIRRLEKRREVFRENETKRQWIPLAYKECGIRVKLYEPAEKGESTEDAPTVLSENKAIEEEVSKQEEIEVSEHEENEELAERFLPENIKSDPAEKSNSNTNDVSSWNYVDIRNGVYSSNAELSLACKKEFHRRMRAYNEWKERNAKGTYIKPIKTGEKGQEVKEVNKETPCLDRYFRVATSYLSLKERHYLGMLSKRNLGTWYGHFRDGWIYRQMEISPKCSPKLKITGKDDRVMCRLPLEETSLIKRKGVEIDAEQFENVWKKNFLKL